MALYAPQATVNRIDNYEVVVNRAPVCQSASTMCWSAREYCISHAEPVSSALPCEKRANDIALKCKYCEKEFSHNVVLAN